MVEKISKTIIVLGLNDKKSRVIIFILGGLFRFKLGLRPALGAAILGGAMGATEGLLAKGLIWMQGDDYESYMLKRYEECVAVSKAYANQKTESNMTTRDAWLLKTQQSEQEEEKIPNVLTKVIIDFLRDVYRNEANKD